MKTITTPYAIPVAMLAASLFLAAPSAQAEPTTKTFEVRFGYNSASDAATIYTDLHRTAKRACSMVGSRSSLRMHKYTTQCAAGVVDEGVRAIGRPDIAALHYGRTLTQVANNR